MTGMPRLLSPFEIGELSIPGIWSSGFREDNLNPIEGGGGGGQICSPYHVFAYTRVYIQIHAPIFFDNSSF